MKKGGRRHLQRTAMARAFAAQGDKEAIRKIREEAGYKPGWEVRIAQIITERMTRG